MTLFTRMAVMVFGTYLIKSRERRIAALGRHMGIVGDSPVHKKKL